MYVYLQNTVICVHRFFSKVFVSCRSAWLPAIIQLICLLAVCTCVLWWLYLFISFPFLSIDSLIYWFTQLFLIYPQACSCIELFFVYISSLSKMICAWAFYSIYLAALLVHMATILNNIGVACHHLCSIHSLTNLTNTDLWSTACTDKVSPCQCSIQGGFPSQKNKQILGCKTWGFQRCFSGAAGFSHQGHQGFGNVPIFRWGYCWSTLSVFG